MRKMIGYRGNMREFRSRVRPELCRCGMLGLTIAGNALRIQARIHRATAVQPVPKKAACRRAA